LLFVDEIHRFNRSQQDGFLPYVEDGTITLVGATTENPSFELNAALLSRAQVLILRRLDNGALEKLLERAEALTGRALPLTPEAREALIASADGDGRFLLNQAETLFSVAIAEPLDPAALSALLHRRVAVYDKDREGHYNLISALHKSLRGSDPQAALYYLARMLVAGEEPLYVLRRMVRFASEDIGLADPQALVQCLAAKDAYDFLGSPEGELAIVQACLYCATAPKSNAAYKAQKAAWKSARDTGSLMPPHQYPERADQADEGHRLWRGLRL
jgi:putative ATPase